MLIITEPPTTPLISIVGREMANKCYRYLPTWVAMRYSHKFASHEKLVSVDLCAQAPKRVMLLQPTTPCTISCGLVENQLAICTAPLSTKGLRNALEN